MSEYQAALFFGAAIIVVFAWEQFNRPSYEKSRELTRLIELLTPSDMRRKTVYWRAYTFYTVILLLVYWILCIYGALLFPVLGLEIPGIDMAGGGEVGASAVPTDDAGTKTELVTGFTPDLQQLSPDVGPAEEADDPGKDPIVPLTVSLTMVGLAPSVPVLQRMEEKVRFAAHRLSGIPTRLVAGSRHLRQQSLGLVREKDETFLIPQQEWERLERYEDNAVRMLDDPLAFREDMAKIIAFRSWILQEKLQLANFAKRDEVAAVETGVARRIERLLLDLDTLSDFESLPDGSNGRTPEQKRAAWEKAAKEADLICADVCVLLMLYVEHGILSIEDGDALGWENPPDASGPDSAQQRYLAQVKLVNYVRYAVFWADRESISLLIWVRAMAAVLLAAFLFGMFFGRDTVTSDDSLVGDSRILIGMNYLFSAALTYVLALLVAVSYHQSAYQNNAWRNVFRDHWSRWLSQFMAVFALSGFAAVVCVVGYNIYATIASVGLERVVERWQAVLRFAIEYQGPAAMRGPVLAMLVLLTIDAWRDGARSEKVLGWLPFITGGVMFVIGFVTRTLSSQVALRDRFSYADSWPVLLEAACITGLIGLAVGLLVRATLVHEFAASASVLPAGRALAPPAAEEA